MQNGVFIRLVIHTMRKTSIFVSSTCFDLRAVREHLKHEIEAMGHVPLLSEYPSFPVSPDLSTVENCKRVVRESADLMILIVGGKRGSLDPSTQKSVVNVEYREALRSGTDCFIFVDKQVLDLLPHYRKNKTADFSSTVDNPSVFEFIDEIASSTKWIFPFSKTEEIISLLKNQLSFRLCDLLTRSREGRLIVPSNFVGESVCITDIVVDKGPRWELRLAGELLKERLVTIDQKFSEIERGLVFRRTRFLAAHDSFPHLQGLIDDFARMIQVAVKILHEEIFEPPGVPGDASQIKRGCDNLYSLFGALYEWEMDVRFVRPHDIYLDLFKTLRGWPNEVLSQFRHIPVGIDALLAQPELSGTRSINLTITPPKDFTDNFRAEVARLSAKIGNSRKA